MANDGSAAPLPRDDDDEATVTQLSRRAPGAARRGPSQNVKPVLSEALLNRMKAAIDAENAQGDPERQDDPNTEPLPRVIASAATSKRSPKRPLSPSGAGPDFEVPPDHDMKPEGTPRPPRPAEEPPRAEEPPQMDEQPRAELAQRARKPSHDDAPPLADEILRVAKALRGGEPDQPQAADTGMVAAATPPPPPTPAPPALAPPAPPAPPAEPQPAAWPARPAGGRGVPATVTHGTGPTPGSIGWLWPEETPMPGGGGRWRPPRGQHFRVAALAAAAVVVLGGLGVAVGFFVHHTPVSSAAHGTSSPPATVRPTGPASPAHSSAATAGPDSGQAAYIAAAANWIKQQVSAGTDVACDAQTCAALTADEFPAAREVQVELSAQSLSNASIVVMTPELRVFFRSVNSSLGGEVTPTVLASFGGVSIHVIYQAGASAYQAALSHDVQARIQLGQQLLNAGQVSASPSARSALDEGYVDARLLLALQALASQQPIDVVSFSDSGAGASAGAPFRVMDLATTDPSSTVPQGEYVGSLHQMLIAHANFPAPFKIGRVPLVGQVAVQVEYLAPSPLSMNP
jgi:hypothetical protein